MVGKGSMRIGVFGGSFDPPHVGHLILSAEALEQLKLDKVLWLLAAMPPHKGNQALSSIPNRIELVEAAISGNSDFELSRIDIDRPGPQYTVDSMRILSEQYPMSDMILLIGGDSLHDFPEWYHPEELLGLCKSLGVMRRPQDDIQLEELEVKIPGIANKIEWIDAPLLEISSSQIRERIAGQKTYRYYLHAGVYDIIKQKQMYHPTNR